jgi:hypothetical protein
MDNRILPRQTAGLRPQVVDKVAKVRYRNDLGLQTKDRCLQNHQDHHQEGLENRRLYLREERFHLE